MEYTTKVEGENCDRKVLLFALSTCGWCKKTKRLLQELKTEYEYVDMDLLHEEEKKEVRKKVKKHNPSMNFPTIVIDEGDVVIIGYDEDRIREELCR